MLANKEDKNLPKENTRLNFISSLQSPLLPALLLCRVHSDPSGRQWVDRQSRSVYRAFSFLFCAPHLCSMLQRMQFPSGMNLLWSGLIQSPHSLFGAVPAAGWAHPAPTAPLGCACLTIEQLLLSHCLFPLFFRPILDTFSQRCHKLLQMAWLWPLVCLLQGVSITEQDLNSCHRGHPCSHLSHQNLVLYT